MPARATIAVTPVSAILGCWWSLTIENSLDSSPGSWPKCCVVHLRPPCVQLRSTIACAGFVSCNALFRSFIRQSVATGSQVVLVRTSILGKGPHVQLHTQCALAGEVFS